MGDISSMNREKKKRQLKQQVVRTPGHNHQNTESDQVIKHTKHKARKRRFITIMIVLILLGTISFAAYRYLNYYQYTDYQILWEAPTNDGNFVEYTKFGGHLLKYTKDGAAMMDSQGKNIWMQSYEMKSPIAVVNGSYAAIADQQGNSIYIFDKNGCVGIASTLLPILRITVSEKGVIAAIVEDSKANYIMLYKKDGTQLDIAIKGLLGGDVGYPLDISLSPDGTQLIGSYLYLNNGTLKGRVAFHNFSEVGKNIPDRLVAGYDDIFANSIVARTQFLSETYSCAFADDGLAFFSSEYLASPELIKHIPIEEEIRSIVYSDQYVGMIVNTNSGENPYRMDFYGINGDLMFSKELDYQYRYIDIDGELVILYNEDSCRVYNMSGTLKFSGSFDWTVSKIVQGRYTGTLLVIGPQVMKEIKLQ